MDNRLRRGRMHRKEQINKARGESLNHDAAYLDQLARERDEIDKIFGRDGYYKLPATFERKKSELQINQEKVRNENAIKILEILKTIGHPSTYMDLSVKCMENLIDVCKHEPSEIGEASLKNMKFNTYHGAIMRLVKILEGEQKVVVDRSSHVHEIILLDGKVKEAVPRDQ